MARRPVRGIRRSLIAAVCLVVATAGLLTGSQSGSPAIRGPLRVLQMNLCDSGIAPCYTGRSVSEAGALIRADAPDVVTVNEVCRDDVSMLDRNMIDAHPRGIVVSAFKAADDRRTSSAFRCLNGEPYGIGLLAYIPAPSRGYSISDGIYPAQDLNDPEERAWLCLDAVTFYACTTHLASTSTTVAFAQCDYLLDTVIPAVRAHGGGYEPTVLGGDFNLRYGGSPDVRACVPSGYLRTGDGGVQDILATSDFALSSDRSIGMSGTTDHPGLLVAFTTRKAGI